VVLALAGAGAARVVVVGRSAERVAAAAELGGAVGRPGAAEEAADAELVVNATPVGMAGHPGGPAVEPAHLGPGQLVADLVYHPAITPLVEVARQRGATAVNGLSMLIHQAALAFRLWTGDEPPLEVMSAAAMAALVHVAP
jgi:shikimate dehydrogenase